MYYYELWWAKLLHIPKREIWLLNKGGIRNGFHNPRPQSVALNLGLNHLRVQRPKVLKTHFDRADVQQLYSWYTCATYLIINLRKIHEKAWNGIRASKIHIMKSFVKLTETLIWWQRLILKKVNQGMLDQRKYEINVHKIIIRVWKIEWGGKEGDVKKLFLLLSTIKQFWWRWIKRNID